ncbi:MAG TPA: flagellar basal body rod protein FlgB, partial [Oligoflexia bacterium]|nr:flagellar basal body rod protein FlgB [Oligoflexia bacterium]
MDLFDNTLKALERSLDLYYKRHQILASNAANSETPKYQARELDFAGELDKALGNAAEPLVKTNPLHMDLTTSEGPRILPDNTGAVGADGNNVDID